MNKKKLAIILSKLKEPEKPKPYLEQYTIPGDLAAEILNLAYLAGDIKGKTIFDFGCGSGRLSIGSALLGAKTVVGIDIDKSSLKTAKENKKLVEREFKIKNLYFVLYDINNWYLKADVIIQNPPFGIQRKHSDRLFLEKSLECGKKIYSLHRNGYKKTRDFLINFIKSRKGKILSIQKMSFTLPRIFKFHKKRIVRYDVDLYVIKS